MAGCAHHKLRIIYDVRSQLLHLTVRVVSFAGHPAAKLPVEAFCATTCGFV